MKKVEVWLYQTSEPLVHNAISTYTKGALYCVYADDGLVYKYPISHLFRAIEGYGTHGGDKAKGPHNNSMNLADCCATIENRTPVEVRQRFTAQLAAGYFGRYEEFAMTDHKSSLDERSFNAGVLSALAIIAFFDEQTIFDEIVKTIGEDELVKAARRDGAMRWSGLSRYGYGKNHKSHNKSLHLTRAGEV